MTTTLLQGCPIKITLKQKKHRLKIKLETFILFEKNLNKNSNLKIKFSQLPTCNILKKKSSKKIFCKV